MSSATIWEAHKAYIRGKLISLGAGKKKVREANKKKKIRELQELENKHKNTKEIELYKEMVKKRAQLRDLMAIETRNIFRNVSQERYVWGNKPGKYLARISKEYKPYRKNKESRWTVEVYTLYSIRTETQEQKDIRLKKIREYISKKPIYQN